MFGQESGEADGDPAQVEALLHVLSRADRTEIGNGHDEPAHSRELIGPLPAGGDQAGQIERADPPPRPIQQVGDRTLVFSQEPGDLSDRQRKPVVEDEHDLSGRPDRRIRTEGQPLEDPAARPPEWTGGLEEGGSNRGRRRHRAPVRLGGAMRQHALVDASTA